MDKKRKKELREEFKRAEEARARDRLGLSSTQLLGLLAFLEDSLRGNCDHTLKLTKEWAAEVGVDSDHLAASVGEFGGFCDCEVLFNVTPDKFKFE